MSRVVRAPDRQLAPWDQAPYFQPIKESLFSSIGIQIVVAVADPTRVGLIFANHGNGTVDVSTNPNMNVGSGISVDKSLGAIYLTHKDFGPLVQQTWYAAINGASPTLTVIEVRMAKFPGE